MITKANESLRELHEALLLKQTEEENPQIKSNINEVLYDIERLRHSLHLLNKILVTQEMEKKYG